MENSNIDFEQIEQELQELIRRFSKADTVLRELEEIQIEFENLAETHKQLKKDAKETSQLNSEASELITQILQSYKSFEKRFNELHDNNQLKTENLKSEILELNQQFADKFTENKLALNSLEQRLENIENNVTDLTEQIHLLNQKDASIQNSLEQGLEKIESNVSDLTQQLHGLNQKDASIQNSLEQGLEKIENNDSKLTKRLHLLDQQIASTKKDFKQQKKQMRLLKIAMTMMFLFFIGLFIAVLLEG
jgi:chromosome segregation ATPase